MEFLYTINSIGWHIFAWGLLLILQHFYGLNGKMFKQMLKIFYSYLKQMFII